MRVCAVNSMISHPSGAASSAAPSVWARSTIERPSGVRSARLANRAASRSSSWPTPGAGRNAVARRLPRVMVPVLSSSKVAMSPAASTDRPDRAITFARTNRSIPAMPMALSRAPIVVGIRHTSSATSTTGDSGWPA